MKVPTRTPLPTSIQVALGFLAPTIILLMLSDESKLGPIWSMALALSLPVGLEVYGYLTGHKASLLSLLAIVGILSIGAISFLGLNEQWLGVRRAGIYVIGAIGLVVITRYRRDLLKKGLERVLDMPAVEAATKTKAVEANMVKLTATAAYLFAAVLFLIGIWSYVLTLIVISAPTGSSAFNAEYAELRVLSLPYVTLPFMVAVTALLMWLLGRMEKLTGLSFEQLLRKKR